MDKMNNYDKWMGILSISVIAIVAVVFISLVSSTHLAKGTYGAQTFNCSVLEKDECNASGGVCDWENGVCVNVEITNSSPQNTCDDGQYLSGTSCLDCPAGYYCKNGVKVACQAGKMSFAKSSQCSNCPTGMFSSSAGSNHCEYCPAGSWSTEGSATCSEPCPQGYACVNGQQDKCPDTMYSNEGKSCDTCPAGYSCKNGIKELCTGNRYQDQTGKSECKVCSSGNVNEARTECIITNETASVAFYDTTGNSALGTASCTCSGNETTCNIKSSDVPGGCSSWNTQPLRSPGSSVNQTLGAYTCGTGSVVKWYCAATADTCPQQYKFTEGYGCLKYQCFYMSNEKKYVWTAGSNGVLQTNITTEKACLAKNNSGSSDSPSNDTPFTPDTPTTDTAKCYVKDHKYVWATSQPANSGLVSSITTADKCKGCETGYAADSNNNCVKPNSSPDSPSNPQTGAASVILVWMIGLMAIGYSVWYFKRSTNNN